MLGWIWVYEGPKDELFQVQVKFDDLYYNLIISYPRSIPGGILMGNIIENTCSRRRNDRGKLVYQDYRNLNLEEIYSVIFLRAPESERERREREYNGIRQRDYKIIIVWHPNRYEIYVEDYLITIWKRLPRRTNKKRVKVIKWLERAKEVRRYRNDDYISIKDISIPFSDLLWFLKKEGKDDIVEMLVRD